MSMFGHGPSFLTNMRAEQATIKSHMAWANGDPAEHARWAKVSHDLREKAWQQRRFEMRVETAVALFLAAAIGFGTLGLINIFAGT